MNLYTVTFWLPRQSGRGDAHIPIEVSVTATDEDSALHDAPHVLMNIVSTAQANIALDKGGV